MAAFSNEKLSPKVIDEKCYNKDYKVVDEARKNIVIHFYWEITNLNSLYYTTFEYAVYLHAYVIRESHN